MGKFRDVILCRRGESILFLGFGTCRYLSRRQLFLPSSNSTKSYIFSLLIGYKHSAILTQIRQINKMVTDSAYEYLVKQKYEDDNQIKRNEVYFVLYNTSSAQNSLTPFAYHKILSLQTSMN